MSGLSDSRAVHVDSRTETDAIKCRPKKAKFLCPPVLLPSTKGWFTLILELTNITSMAARISILEDTIV